MKAWVGELVGDRPTYRLVELPAPAPRARELLVRVRAVGVNRLDQEPKRSHFGHTEPAPASIPGIEVAGEVASVGPQCGPFEVGDRVMGMVQGGCVEFVRMHHQLAMRVPASLSWEAAAAIPVSYLTAHDALFMHGDFPPDCAVLVHAVTSGVGLAALQLAKRAGARLVLGSSGSQEKLERVRQAGLDLALFDPYRGFAAAVLAGTNGHGADLVVDTIGGAILNETIRATAIGGRIIAVGRFGGADANLDLNLLAARRVSVVGVTFRSRSLAQHAAIVNAFVDAWSADIQSGLLQPIVDRVYPFDALPDAIDQALRRGQYGKRVLLGP